jgi:hypothetical protein
VAEYGQPRRRRIGEDKMEVGRVGGESLRVLPRLRQMTSDWMAADFLLIACGARGAAAPQR